jgi:opacity protein-like surface antigen
VHASLAWQFGGAATRFRPYLTAGAGATFFSATDQDGEAKFSPAFGAGVKWLPNGKLGARFQVRYNPTYLNDSASDFCDPFGFCQSWLHQLELSGGLSLRF